MSERASPTCSRPGLVDEALYSFAAFLPRADALLVVVRLIFSIDSKEVFFFVPHYLVIVSVNLFKVQVDLSACHDDFEKQGAQSELRMSGKVEGRKKKNKEITAD